ncbi:HTH-type transcriptional regulator MetR [Sodalis praecaptivus]
MIELKHLRTLQALRNSGSLAASASQLHQTQSALSHQFSDLEQRLGFRLFVRKSQPLRFTPQGRFCCNWRNKSCRRCSRRCKPASNRIKLRYVWLSNAIAASSG